MKVIDFGLAGFLEPGKEFIDRDCVMGTRNFISPESFAFFIIDEQGTIDLEAMKGNINLKFERLASL